MASQKSREEKCSKQEGGIRSVKCHGEVKEEEDNRKVTIGFSNRDTLGDLGRNNFKRSDRAENQTREN